jgi:hypothetical protein
MRRKPEVKFLPLDGSPTVFNTTIAISWDEDNGAKREG